MIKHTIQTGLFFSAIIALPLNAANTSQHGHSSEYAGQEKRHIKSLSKSDIAQLRAGAGWGLAKAAELNGVPGPLHLLEMREQIGLSALQIEAIEVLYQQMRQDAMALGEQLIEKELQLERRFLGDIPNAEELKQLLVDIGKTRAELRYVHLAAHLATPDILSEHQIHQYNRLRGYGAGDPCESVPEGHNPEMWKKHNGCD